MTTTIKIKQQDEFLNIINALVVCNVSFYYDAENADITIDGIEAKEVDHLLLKQHITEAAYQLYECLV